MAPPPLSNRTNQTNHTNQINGARWYAIRTRARHEKQVRDRLQSQGIEQLLPTVTKLSQWKDRKKKIEMPLFSCYCFAQFAWPDRLTVQQTAGVVQIVGNGKGPEPISEDEIDAIRMLMKSPLPYDAHPYLHEGMPVQVIRGPLDGIRGTLLRKDKPFRLVISVHLIHQAASVEINASDVVPL
jgi:transcription termination/antitermination protein NusG